MGVGSVVLVLACIAGFSVRAWLRNSDVHVDAVTRARSNAQLVAQLGAPVEPGFMPMGNISISTGGGGSADLRIPLRGPRGKGRLIAVAEREAGRWHYESLTFESADAGDALRLAEPGAPIGMRPALQQ